MKRIWAALLILAVMAIFSFVGHSCVHNVTNRAADSLQTAKELALQGDFNAARAELKTASDEFGRDGHILELFLKREYVTNIRVNLAGLDAYAYEESAPDLYSEIDKAVQQVRMMEHMYDSIL